VKVRRVTIRSFRGVRSGKVLLDSHSLLVGVNAVGKSTVCEALDLALGLERLSRRPVIDEYDFYEARYRDDEPETGRPPEIRIEVVLTDLSEEASRRSLPISGPGPPRTTISLHPRPTKRPSSPTARGACPWYSSADSTPPRMTSRETRSSRTRSAPKVTTTRTNSGFASPWPARRLRTPDAGQPGTVWIMRDWVDRCAGSPMLAGTVGADINVNAAALAPLPCQGPEWKALSEHNLAGLFGRISKCWVHSRIGESCQSPNAGVIAAA
jgi:hypothetical protein